MCRKSGGRDGSVHIVQPFGFLTGSFFVDVQPSSSKRSIMYRSVDADI
jgi:hypothetical protein